MKNALKSKKVWIFFAILATLSVGLPFLILVITLNIEKAAPFQYPVLLGAFAAVYVLVGFVWGDLHTVAHRRKTKNWDGEVPEEIKRESWLRRWPFYLAAILTITVFMVFEIIFWSTGHYPFL
ncbi:MAG: hypothetical protein K6F07_02255 [Bacilli bacterium]|nr:hypothetical protein [Bacilli bacterium]